MQQYKLAGLAHKGQVLIKIWKDKCGLPQAGIIANERLVKYLAKYGYAPAQYAPGLFKHKTRSVTFSLCVDNVGIKYEGSKHAQHLGNTIKTLYTVTTDWSGELYYGLTIQWNCAAGTVDISMPNYIQKALTKFQHTPNARAQQHSPHAWTSPN
jgi:hypothetical protein